MKKFFSVVFVIIVLLVGFSYKKELTEFIYINFFSEQFIITSVGNIYEKESNSYIENKDFYPNTKEDITNILYTALNGGLDEVVFFCTSKYNNCIFDAIEVINSQEIQKINNFIHPYNSYKSLIMIYDDFGKVNIKITKLYSKEEVNALEEKVNNIVDAYITDNMSNEEKVKTIHDYIINTTKYDEDLEGENSSSAYGALFDGKAICGGYTDAMAIFLNKFGIENYKLASINHVWNYVYLDNEWLHLDVTWDDPITNTKEDVLIYTYYLISDSKLKELNISDHDY